MHWKATFEQIEPWLGLSSWQVCRVDKTRVRIMSLWHNLFGFSSINACEGQLSSLHMQNTSNVQKHLPFFLTFRFQTWPTHSSFTAFSNKIIHCIPQPHPNTFLAIFSTNPVLVTVFNLMPCNILLIEPVECDGSSPDLHSDYNPYTEPTNTRIHTLHLNWETNCIQIKSSTQSFHNVFYYLENAWKQLPRR